MSDWCDPTIHANIDAAFRSVRMIMLFRQDEYSYLISDTFQMFQQHSRAFGCIGKYGRLPEVGCGLTYMDDGAIKELHSGNMLTIWSETTELSTEELALAPWVLDKGRYAYGRVLFKGKEPIFLNNAYLKTLEGETATLHNYRYFQRPGKAEAPVLVRWKDDPVALIMPIRVQHPEILLDDLARCRAYGPNVVKVV